MRRVLPVITSALALVVSLLVASPAGALTGPSGGGITAAKAVVKTADLSAFSAGNIVSDAVFFDSGTMTEAQIQAFLEERVPNCVSGYTCLKDWYDTSRSTTADAMCGAYSGGVRERASRIIYKVARACGINPQVILVTLQKEQGLVTHVWPSDWRYTIAMGQGCPDTSACDERYYGFFNQVYGAAWQFKRYANPPGTSQYFTWYAPGNTWNILYNPDRSCGSSPVAVKNQATANLYYYTPYQPNSAALRAGYGTGDGCSAYGNRNFFNYFTDWFGSTQVAVSGAVAAAWEAAGGASGELGYPTSVLRCGLVDGGCYQNFQGGSIHLTPSGQAFATSGAVRSAWREQGWENGELGYPSGVLRCGLVDGGCYQNFQGGSIHLTPSGQAFATSGAVRSAWREQGWENGELGYPSGVLRCGLVDGGCYQNFQGGSIHLTPSGQAFATSGAVRSAWREQGWENGELGYPSGVLRCGLVDGGCYQNFQGGSIHLTPSGQAFATSGAVRSAWREQGWENGELGYPSGVLRCGLVDGGCYQNFQGGSIHLTPSGQAFATSGAVRSAWREQGWENGELGYPSGVLRCGLVDGGCYQNFQGGSIHWTAATGAWATFGPIREYWRAQGWENGEMGYPTGPVTSTDSGAWQEFEGGTATWDSSSGGVSFAP
ncbi:hypothetical protein P0L94_09055 [Microbacter sp. GSS18]|nr:hypothetical protein P0L94_09055 [Microbacter sp. GSS18]